ncbi:MAG: hypothetical protein ACRDMJ_02315 [Solirubrobacteraceae bacterium]
MQHVNFQTVTLCKGKHSSPDSGACVMELASMLAGEPFSDHPRTVSRPIAALLRGYNDLVDDDRRQDLYGYAARVVNSASSAAVERRRIQRLVAWADDIRRQHPRWSILPRRLRRDAHTNPITDPQAAGRYVINRLPCVTDEVHASVLALVDELMALGGERHAPAAHDGTSAAAEPVASGV